jgi:hypothetical protein
MIDLLYWALQWSRNHPYPRDFDFVFTEPVYADIELYGEIWDDFCRPEAIIRGQFFTTNSGQKLNLTKWRPIRWLPNHGGEIPENFVAKTYKVIIYNDSIRTNIIKTIEGTVNIFDPYLLDEHDWFETKIIKYTPNQSVGINQTINIFCTILQPRHSRLMIKVQRENQQPEVILDDDYSDLVKNKDISYPYTFSQWGTYKIKFQLKTRALDWINNWCPATQDYVEEFETIIQVGDT